MTNEQLQNGKKIAEEIEQLEAQLAGWKYSTGFDYRTITLSANVKGYARTFDKINPAYIDFKVLKTLTIAHIEKELNELKTEFEKL